MRYLRQHLRFPLDENPSLKCFHVEALIKLSSFSGLYPECMILKGIKLVGGAAIDGGGYGDICKGVLEDQEIAVKVLKVYRKSDKEELLKVG